MIDLYPLIDGWVDGAIEERCWVPVSIIDGPQYAEDRARGGRDAAIDAYLRATIDYAYDAVIADGGKFVLRDGTTWQRPEGKPDGYGGYVVVTDDPCGECYDGSDAYWPPLLTQPDGYHGPPGPCSSCHGSRKLHITYDEGCPWVACKPEDEGAVEFYVLEVAEDETARIAPQHAPGDSRNRQRGVFA